VNRIFKTELAARQIGFSFGASQHNSFMILKTVPKGKKRENLGHFEQNITYKILRVVRGPFRKTRPCLAGQSTLGYVIPA
jgi:hypothetical protein